MWLSRPPTKSRKMNRGLDSLGRACLSYIRWQFWLLANRDCGLGQGETTVSSNHGLYRLYKWFLVGKPSQHGPTWNGHYIVNRKVAVFTLYLDNVITFFRSFRKHLDNISIVLGLLSRAGVSVKLKKYFFLEGRIYKLGQVVHPGRLVMLMKATDAFYRL